MKGQLSEEEMRQALFGPQADETVSSEAPEQPVIPVQKPAATSRKTSKALSPKLRVTLRVTKDFEGTAENFVYDANTLSTFTAELEAKAEAKKKKYRYFEVISIKPIG